MKRVSGSMLRWSLLVLIFVIDATGHVLAGFDSFDLIVLPVVGVVAASFMWSASVGARDSRDALRESEERLVFAQAVAQVGTWDDDLTTGQHTWSDGMCAIWGIDPADVPADFESFLALIDPRDRENLAEAVAAGRASGSTFEFAYRVTRPDGDTRSVLCRGRAINNERGETVRVIGVAIDETDRRRADESRAALEEQLRRAQRLESIGRLAGGVAHDFNNLLLAMRGYGEFALRAVERGDDPTPDLNEVMHATDRATALTRQLLAFSRSQMLRPEVIELNEVVTDVNKLFSRIVREDIEIDVVVSPEPVLVTADRGQLEQVIANLVVNARDAMPDGGTLSIEIGTSELSSPLDPELPPGRYALVAVSDTGSGMAPETAAKIFDPFFTTKGTQGTGLGLATVHGIVKQSGGAIWVYSEPGAGTTFKVYLPLTDGVPATATITPHPQPALDAQGAGETVLLVEDQSQVREVIAEMIEGFGYTVLVAEDGDQAMRIADETEVDLLVTDMMMAGLKGRELAAILRTKRPNLPILYISGYTDDVVVRRGLLEPGAAFLEKPFRTSELSSELHELLKTRILAA